MQSGFALKVQNLFSFPDLLSFIKCTLGPIKQLQVKERKIYSPERKYHPLTLVPGLYQFYNKFQEEDHLPIIENFSALLYPEN